MPRLKDVDKIKRVFDEIRAKDENASGPMVECVSHHHQHDFKANLAALQTIEIQSANAE